MGQLIDKKIIQSRIWHDPNAGPVPPYDYDYSYPITVFEAVMRDMSNNSPNLADELAAIYRLIASKQEIVEPGTAGQLMTWSGVRGQIGAIDVAKAINTDPSQRSHQKVPSERAVGDSLDTKVSNKTFDEHSTDTAIHVTDTEKARWNSMAPASQLNAHESNTNIHVTAEEKSRWNSAASSEDFDDHKYDMNNPHKVTAHQVGTYTRREVDEMFQNIRESFFNYLNILFDDRTNQASLVEYHPDNWNPNYILEFNDVLPDIPDPQLTYFALKPATDYTNNETQDCLIYIKRPGLNWQEVGLQSMNAGDLVIKYPDTTMFVWVQGRFMRLFTSQDSTTDGSNIGTSNRLWRPELNDAGELIWVLSTTMSAPEPMLIKGADGYTPIKGIDYFDGVDGQGMPVGGRKGQVPVKMSDEEYDIMWQDMIEYMEDLVKQGVVLPPNVVLWDNIKNKPDSYNEFGDNTDGYVTQRFITKQFQIVNNTITELIEKVTGDNGVNNMNERLYDHLNDFNNPHRVTASQIGAVTNASFIDHTSNHNNPHNVTKETIGLGNVDNTADIDKPISIAVKAALDAINTSITNITDGVSTLNYVIGVAISQDKTTLSFLYRDKSVVNITIPIVETFQTIYFDKSHSNLVIVLPDGTEHRIDISSVIQVYKGSVSPNIQVVIEDNIVKATVVPGSIGELEISPSVHLRNSPTTTTQPVSDRSTRIATTEYVRGQVVDNLLSYETDRPLSANMGRILDQRKADVQDILDVINDLEGITVIDNLQSMSTGAALSANMGRYLDLTKAPRVHTDISGATYGRATVNLFGHVKAADVDPLMDGTIFRGTDDGTYARGDHRHPTDETRAPIHFPDVGHNQYGFTGEPRSTLAPDNSNDDRIATTEWIRRNAVGVSLGDCRSIGEEAIKIVTLRSDFMDNPVFIRQTGSTVAVTFTHDDAALTTVYLNVHGTGPAAVTFGGFPITNGMLKGNYTYIFTFDGTYWQLMNPSGIPTVPDDDNSNALVSSNWVRRNAIGTLKGYCTTSGNVGIKIAQLQSDYASEPVFIRQTGSAVAITFDYTDSCNSPTYLDVQGTGAAPVTYAGTPVIANMISANCTHLFIFDGSCWNIINPAAIPTVPDDDNSGRLVSSEWVRRNVVGVMNGECTTSGSNPAKIATLRSTFMNPVTFMRQIGTTVAITFSNKDSSGAATPTTLNVQESGAARILFAGEAIRDGMIGRNCTHMFTYDGTYWRLINPMTNEIYNPDGINIGPGSPKDPDDDDDNPGSQDNSVINLGSGHNGFTTQGDGSIDGQGRVNRVWIGINFAPRNNDVDITFSDWDDAWAAKLGDGSTVVIKNPKLISATRSNCVVQFEMDTAYPSNSPAQLIYRTNNAWINIKER